MSTEVSIEDGDTIKLDLGTLAHSELDEGDTVRVEIGDFSSIGVVSARYPLRIKLKKITPKPIRNKCRMGETGRIYITKLRSRPKNFWAGIRQYFGE